MKAAEIFKRAFLPRVCLLCDEVIDYDRKEPLCDECSATWLASLDLMCPKCGFDSDYCSCLPERIREINNSIACFGVFYTPKVENPANRIVYILKRENYKEAFEFAADIIYKKLIKLCAKHSINYKNFIITFPARRRKSVIKYGYDHAFVLAKTLARKMGIEVYKCFKNNSDKEQKTLSRSDRFANASSTYKMYDEADVSGKNVFIVDDVMTSGATLNVCARLLLEKGARCVIPVTFAKDM